MTGRSVTGRWPLVASTIAAALTAACAANGRQPAEPPRYRTVSPGVAFEMIKDSAELVILDVRPRDEYFSSAGHLDGAVNLPAASLAARYDDLRLSPEETVLVYGGDGGSEQIEAVAWLVAHGQRFVAQISGGLEGWLEAGFPVVVEELVSPSPEVDAGPAGPRRQPA